MAKVITLRRQRDFDRLFGAGKKYHHELLTTVVHPRPDSDQARAVFIVGRRVDKRAVVRNRIKRRLREAWRGELANIRAVVRNRIKRRLREAWRGELANIHSGGDVAFVARPPAAEASYHQLAAVVHQHLVEAGLFG